ncbi:SDR family NAD(P)-dependent oxidoreductase [Tistrella bauzanensis]|uniref:SDR family NAD(P)-dependent oxidoreductase n=1 Tax=Tistrella TaxID=171436 RepID=UPI0031F6CAC7
MTTDEPADEPTDESTDPVALLAPVAQGGALLFCFGLGFSARALAAAWMAAGGRVAGTCRGPEKQAVLRDAGIAAHLMTGDRPMDAAGVADLGRAVAILSSVGPSSVEGAREDGGPADGAADGAADPVLRLHGADIAAAAAAGLARGAAPWIGYLSTTGVYGDHGGGWVDEDTPTVDAGGRGGRRVAAERAWAALAPAAPAHLFRLAGIYGPGRSALDTVRAGRAHRVVKPGQVFSRIHVADIAAVLAASIAAPAPGRAYNVCDNEAAPPQDVILHACQLLEVTPPPEVPFEQATLSPMARSFYADNKRVRNTRIREELGVRLRYPDYRAGLAAQLAAERSQTIGPSPA